MSEENNLKGIFANVNDDILLRDCGNLYAENQKLQQENQQLKAKNKEQSLLLIEFQQMEYERDLYKSLLDEIREKIDFAKATIEYGGDCSDVGYNFLISADKIVEILDKAGKQ